MKKSFVLYLDQYEPIKDLNFEQKGELLDAMFSYNLSHEVKINDPMVKMAFSFFEQTFKRDCAKYLKRCEKNKENINKRWNKKDTTVYDGKNGIPVDTKNTDSDSDKIVIVKEDSDSGSDKKVKVKEYKEYPPDILNFVQDFQNYIKSENGNIAPKITDSLIENGCDSIDKLIRLDNFTLDFIIDVLRWSVKDNFWSGNVLSLASVRKSKDGTTKFQKIANSFKRDSKGSGDKLMDKINSVYDEIMEDD